MGLFNVPEESFEIEILEDDLDVFNDKKIESEKIIIRISSIKAQINVKMLCSSVNLIAKVFVAIITG